ncbi:MAG: outer membrane protein [Bdellovibrionales bacterium]
MKKTLLLTTALIAFNAAPALADDTVPTKGFYTALGMGVSMTNDADVDFKTAGVKDSLNVDDDFAIAGAVGYRFTPWLRVEAEIGHFGGELGNNADVGVMTYMANAYVDWQNSSRFTPYAGFGLGMASISTDISTTAIIAGSSYTLSSDDSDTAFAWQAGVGVGYRITDRWSADLGWRYIATNDVSLNTTLAGTALPVETSLSSNIIRAGIRYEF